MRAWIIGNGPSLNQTPLHRLTEEVTFGLNKIHLLYPKTKWRPTYWCSFDRRHQTGSAWFDDVLLHLKLGEECFVRDDILCGNDIPDVPNLHREHACGHMSPMDSTQPEQFGGAWHLPQLCRTGGSALMAIQLAVRMGYGPLYVVGCDLGYKDADNQNWFVKDYLPPDTYKAEQARRFNKLLEDMHRIAKSECDVRGINIYNAGVGGDLRAYPRVKFEEVL